MAETVLYLCDHNRPCANSEGCKLNGGPCNHTIEKGHSINYKFGNAVPDLEKDFTPFRRVLNTDVIYMEKDSQDSQSL